MIQQAILHLEGHRHICTLVTNGPHPKLYGQMWCAPFPLSDEWEEFVLRMITKYGAPDVDCFQMYLNAWKASEARKP